MISVMFTTNNSGVFDAALQQLTDSIGDNRAAASTSGSNGGGGDLIFKHEGVRVSSSESDRSIDNTVADESEGVSKLENEDYQPSSSGDSKKRNVSKSQHKKVTRVVEGDYDSVLSAFDEFVAGKGKIEGVGGYEVGDMVWAKVISHPWWPGQIYSEALASPFVRRSKREGHVLVAFFGDSSYGWFEPAELIPFEENFAENSKQMSSRAFVNAVEEAIDEFSRRSSVGLVCRCRSQYNLLSSSVEGYFRVDVGDYEPGLYSLSQISKARDSFRPRDMLSYLKQLVSTPVNNQHLTIELITNKARVLACRKALFEVIDETYAHAFGTVPACSPRPTVPVAIDPSKAPLSGRLLIPEALGKGKISAKPTNTKYQTGKDKYLCKQREQPVQVKSKKAVGLTTNPFLVDGSEFSARKLHHGHMRKNSESRINNAEQRTPSHQKAHKRLAGKLSSENTVLVEQNKKQKKEIGNDTSADFMKSHVAIGNSGIIKSFSGMPLHVALGDTNLLGNQNAVVENQPSSPVDSNKIELSMFVRDLQGLALNPFHGEERCCPAVIRRIFLKYRSLVYKKSLVSLPLTKNEGNEAPSGKLPTVSEIINKSIAKPVKPSVRPDDPTKGGRKLGPLEGIKKKRKLQKLSEPEDIEKMKKLNDTEVIKKKTNYSKILAGERKIPQRSTISTKSVLPSLPNAKKLECGKIIEKKSLTVRKPSMLVIKFPDNAALPSGAELRAKFICFGPLDHSETRVFWKSYQCHLVYLNKADAEAALDFVIGSRTLFGNLNVKAHIKELGVDAAESKPVVPKITGQPLQLIKSCLKKPARDESGMGCGRGGSRVNFVLGGDENVIEVASSSTNSLDANSKNSPNIIPQTTVMVKPTSQFEKLPMNMPCYSEQENRALNFHPVAQKIPSAPANPIDISQQMLYLLMKCSDLINNMKGVLGYMPYYQM